MTSDLGDPPPPAQADWAYFLDVDGTLIEIADRPEAVHVPAALVRMLGDLHAAVGGACALVSGRAIAELDGLFAPLQLPTSGLHGVEWRDSGGTVHRVTDRNPSSEEVAALSHALDVARAELAAFAASRPSLRVEDKGSALALHYRAAPAFARDAEAVADAIVAAHPGLVAQRGKMVVELKPAGVDKGIAVGRYLNDPPFAGRRPVFIGDDLTDEYGFQAVNAVDGVSICIGDRVPSSARWRLDTVDAAHRWLGRLTATKNTGSAHGVA